MQAQAMAQGFINNKAELKAANLLAAF